jgi:hypothetical protein
MGPLIRCPNEGNLFFGVLASRQPRRNPDNLFLCLVIPSYDHVPATIYFWRMEKVTTIFNLDTWKEKVS